MSSKPKKRQTFQNVPPDVSFRMSRVRPIDTKPENTVRKLLFGLGYRYRIHDYKLPGRPDIIFSRKKKVIFVHGCFWHQHPGCPRATVPSKNKAYWQAKFTATKRRDQENLRKLIEDGWNCLVVWECGLQDKENLAGKLTLFLEN